MAAIVTFRLPYELAPRREETAAWCSTLKRPLTSDSLWAADLKATSVPHRVPWIQRRAITDGYCVVAPVPGLGHEVVEEVVRLKASRIPHDAAIRDTGRLLAFAPSLSLVDGAAEVTTQGFFDVNNTPPWGAWLGMTKLPTDVFGMDEPDVRDALIAWIPHELVHLADLGISVIPERCVAWVE